MVDWAGGGSCGSCGQCSGIELLLGLLTAAVTAAWFTTVATMVAAVTATWFTTVAAAAWLTTVAATAAWLTAMTATVVAAVVAAVTAAVMATIAAAIVTAIVTTITAAALLCGIDFFADTKLRRYRRQRFHGASYSGGYWSWNSCLDLSLLAFTFLLTFSCGNTFALFCLWLTITFFELIFLLTFPGLVFVFTPLFIFSAHTDTFFRAF